MGDSIPGFKVDTTDANNVDYLQYFHCNAKVNDKSTCYNFQPNWTELGETDGWPRFGRLDPVTAVYVDATSNLEADFFDIRLWNGAISIASAAVVIAITFLSF